MAAGAIRGGTAVSGVVRFVARFAPPAAAPGEGSSERGGSLAVRIALVVVGAAALWTLGWNRLDGGYPTLWAEDGVFFVQDALRHGVIENVTTPANGYLMVLPRLLAQIVVLFPLAQAPTLIAICGVSVTTACAIWVYLVTGQWFSSQLLRAVVASSVVVVPLDIGGDELLGTINNLQWPLLFALFWTLLLVPRRRSETVLASVIAALASVTAGLVVVLVPLAIVMVCSQRRAIERSLPAIIVIAGSLIQVAAHLIRPHDQPGSGAHNTTTTGWIDILSVRVSGQAFLGTHLTSRLWVHLGGWTDVVCLVPIAVIIVIGARYAPPRGRWLIAASLCAAVAIAVVPLAVRPHLADVMRPHLSNGQPFFAGARYMYNPMLLTLTAAVAAADALRTRSVLIGRAAAVAVALAFVIVTAAAFRLPATRNGVPPWKAQLSVAQRYCQDPGSRVTVAPYPSWVVVIPCDRLR